MNLNIEDISISISRNWRTRLLSLILEVNISINKGSSNNGNSSTLIFIASSILSISSYSRLIILINLVLSNNKCSSSVSIIENLLNMSRIRK